jgi:outer membrane protein OmpA-like peptidoglycan-associated protein
MKTKITLLASLLFATAIAGPAAAGPDFASESHGPKKLAASEAKKKILPTEDVAFAFNSAVLLDSSHQQIETVAAWLARNPEQNIVLEGHADSTGAAIYNEDLAARRADIVRLHLIGHGISSDRILMIVFGEAKAKRTQSPMDRRVVLHATADGLETAAKRVLKQHRALHAIWTRKGVLFTETHGVTPGALARR